MCDDDGLLLLLLLAATAGCCNPSGGAQPNNSSQTHVSSMEFFLRVALFGDAALTRAESIFFFPQHLKQLK